MRVVTKIVTYPIVLYLLSVARGYIAQGIYDRARKYLSAAVRLDPTHAEAHFLLGQIEQALGEPDNALVHFDEAIRHKDGYVDAILRRGLAYLKKGDYKRALSDVELAAGLAPSNPEVYLLRAHIYRRTDNLTGALEVLSECLIADPEYAPAHVNQGFVYQQQNDQEQAVIAFTQAIDSCPTLAYAYYYRAVAYDALGQHDRAKEDYQNAVQLNMALPQEIYNNAAMAKDRGDIQEALSDFKSLLALTSDSHLRKQIREHIVELETVQ